MANKKNNPYGGVKGSQKNNNKNNAPRFLSGSEALALTAVGQRAASQPVFSEGSRQSQVGAQNYRAPAPAAPQAQAPAPAAPQAPAISQPMPGQGPEYWAPAATEQYAGPPEFDWDSWNLQMMEQQAAVWASMDAMNAQFLQQQEAWQAQQAEQGFKFQNRSSFGSIGNNPDKAQVKRKKRKKPSTTAAGTKLSIGGDTAAGGVSTGGASAGKTLGIG